MTKLLAQRRQDQPVDTLPNIGDKSYGFEHASFIVVAEVVGMDLLIKNHDPLREDVLSIAPRIGGKGALVNPEYDETHVEEDEFLNGVLSALFGASNEPSFYP